MKASELRIGNLVMYKNELLPVFSVHGDETIRLLKGNESIGCFSLKGSSSIIEPIPITPEILESAGFEKYEKKSGELIEFGHYRISLNSGLIMQYNYIEYCGQVEHFIISNSDDEFYTAKIPIQYLHQLQNLYFALTGYELEIESFSRL